MYDSGSILEVGVLFSDFGEDLTCGNGKVHCRRFINCSLDAWTTIWPTKEVSQVHSKGIILRTDMQHVQLGANGTVAKLAADAPGSTRL